MISSTKIEYGNLFIGLDKIIRKSNASRELKIHLKPKDVKISTMTVTCKADTKFNCKNIALYIELSKSNITSVTYGKDGNEETNRLVDNPDKGKKKHKKKLKDREKEREKQKLKLKESKEGKNKCTSIKTKKDEKDVFFNQVSICVDVKSKEENPVNVKLFTNGAIQMTGCVTIENAFEALVKIIHELKKVKAIICSKTLKFIDKPMVTNLSIDIKSISSLNIAMINSDFIIPFKIDRIKLYYLLLAKKYECTYDPTKHACVNIKYEHPEKTISIFVFEKGSILITGAKNCSQVKCAYNFINKFLLQHHSEIKKNDTLTNQNILQYLNGSIKEQKPQKTL
jgi:TATA-box binding protein (TBP) (component of TFIID and TFIIIB)